MRDFCYSWFIFLFLSFFFLSLTSYGFWFCVYRIFLSIQMCVSLHLYMIFMISFGSYSSLCLLVLNYSELFLFCNNKNSSFVAFVIIIIIIIILSHHLLPIVLFLVMKMKVISLLIFWNAHWYCQSRLVKWVFSRIHILSTDFWVCFPLKSFYLVFYNVSWTLWAGIVQ